MKAKEKIKVFVCCENGKTVCICDEAHKRCEKDCSPDVVVRDRFRGWRNICKQDRYGKSKE